jgi:hypothetical protein
MDSQSNTMPLSATEPPPGPQMIETDLPKESLSPIRTDRLYQIAAVTAGLFLLATAL